MEWSFARINNRLAEIFFETKKGKIQFIGHCYVKKSTYKTKKEQRWIKEDTKRFNLTYKNHVYKDGKHLYEQIEPDYWKPKNIKALSSSALK